MRARGAFGAALLLIGDEIAIAFDASKLPALTPHWPRTFLLYIDGFSKEMNLHSAPDRLERDRFTR